MAPRNAEATPAMRKPRTSVGMAPSRAMKSEPGRAAIANRIIGRPERMPTSVPDRRRSAWIDKITGGTARMLNRRPTPASQSRPVATQNSRMALPAAAFFALVCPASHARDGRPADNVGGDPVDPRIHLLRKNVFTKMNGLPGLKRVYARLQRAMPGNDGVWLTPRL